jgi:hypothetical protein
VDRVVWDRLQKSSPVYNGDFIRTADLSEATVTFTGGGTVDLAESSLIQIRFEDSRARVDLTRGGVSVAARKDSSVALSSGDRLIDIGPGGVVSAAASGESLNLHVVEGSALLRVAGETQQAEAGDAFALTGEETLREPLVAVLSPRPNALFVTPENTALPVNFSWRAVNFTDDDYTQIEIAAERNFARILVSLADSTATSARLAPGAYFWRAYAANRNRAASGEIPSRLFSGKLTIIHAPAPRLVSPAQDYAYRYRVRKPAVRFQWTGQKEVSFYLLEAADNPDMNNPALQTRLGGTSLVYSDLGAGRWYWRVTPIFPEGFWGTAQASGVASFVIEQRGGMEAPRPQIPAEGASLNIGREREDAYFSWRHDEEAASYTIRISPRADLSDPLITQTVHDNFFIYRRQETTLQAGRYYWGVSQTDGEGNSSAVSPARAFLAIEGEVIQRTIFPPANYTVTDTLLRDIRFTWKSNLPFTRRFQISNNPQMNGFVVNEAVHGEMFQGRILPAGTYYWRISAEAGDASFDTPPKRFTVFPLFVAPVLEEPGPGEKAAIRAGTPVNFRWQAVEGAEYYQFRLYAEDARGSPLYENAFCRTASQTLEMDSYPDGGFFWTVQAFADEGPLHSRRTGLLAAGHFTKRQLRPVSLEYPPSGHEYPGLDALRRPGVLRWRLSDTPGNSRFVLSRNPNPLTGQAVMDIRNPDTTITLARLPEGTYYWTIRAETEDGFNISAERPFSFRVLPVPLLPEAAGRLPQDNELIDAARLRENRTITFTWQPVEGANGYIFSLFHEETEGQRRLLLRAGPGEAASYTLEDLRTLLVQGDFTWQVEAVSRAADGFMERRGTPGENRFRVDVPVPGAARAKDPGVLYGAGD